MRRLAKSLDEGMFVMRRMCILAGFLLLACNEAEDTSSSTSAVKRQLPQSESEQILYTANECSPVAIQRVSISSNDVFAYQTLDESNKVDTRITRRVEIQNVKGDLVDYSETLLMPEMGDLPSERRQSRFGFLPTATSDRSVRYEDAARLIAGLTPGKSVDLAMTETVQALPDKAGTGVAKLTFVGCGRSTSVIPAAPGEDVLVYRVDLPFSAPGTPGVLSQSVEFEYLVSQRLGWPIAERSPGGTVVLTSTTG